jgi:hypothetical protein
MNLDKFDTKRNETNSINKTHSVLLQTFYLILDSKLAK